MSINTSENNKRIAKNTIVIYVKLILSTIIGLYTSRVILYSLGASDYGLYAVVGGIVSMMNVIGVTMNSVTNRYIAIEIGKGANGNLNKTFNTILCIHIFLALLLLVVGDPLGVYYIKNIANFSPDKLNDAIYVLHLSLIAVSSSVIGFPYNGLIVTREKFVFTSIIEIIQSVVKLIFVVLLAYYAGNRLRFFADIIAFITILPSICFVFYCFRYYRNDIKWNFNSNKKDYKNIFRFTFWLLIGAIAVIGNSQGANMILNFFFSTIVNAAFGLALTVNTYVQLFVRSLTQAALPQIMKSYGEGNHNRSINLVYVITKYSFFMLMLFSIPLVLNIDFVLNLWLGNVPPFTNIFVILMIAGGLVMVIGSGFDAEIQASGKVKSNQIFYSITCLAVLPMAVFLYKLGMPVYTISILTAISYLVVLIYQCNYLTKISAFSISAYLHNTIFPCLFILILSLPLIIIRMVIPGTAIGFVLHCSICVIWIIGTIFFAGISKSEKALIINSTKRKL